MKSVSLARLTFASAAALSLAGCQGQETAPAPEVTASAPAPDAKPGISVSDAVLLLPVVAGRPGAAYFTVTNNGAAATSLAAVHIDGAATTELHETIGGKMEPLGEVALAPGATVKFERGGKHVMAFDLSEPLISAPSAEMTLIFAGGDKISVPIKVQKMTGGMQGMTH